MEDGAMEVRAMAERTAVDKIIADCQRYWIDTHVPRAIVDEMTTELATHLADATAEGKEPAAVVGADLGAFAEAWASEHRPSPRGRATWNDIINSRKRGRVDLLLAAATIGIVVVAIVLAPKEDGMDVSVWRWIWLGLTLVMAVGEMLTAGFFLIPFAVGAGAATLLAFAGVNVPVQTVVFLVVSVIALWYLRRYTKSREDEQPTVGANRFLQQRATVLEPVNRRDGTGRVRLDTEEWRATVDSDDTIEAGTEVVIVEVRGTRFVVERI